MKICYFGVGEKIGKNKVNFQRMKAENYEIVEVFAENKLISITSEKDLGFISGIGRLFAKLKIIPVVYRMRKEISQSDLIFVGYPGHFDLPLAYITSRIFRKPLVFDVCLALYDTFTDDVGVMNKKSLFARAVKIAEKFLYKLPDRIIVDTQILKEYYHTEFSIPLRKIAVLYLGVDESVYAYKPTEASAEAFNVVYYGLYNPIHGVEYIIQAAAMLDKEKDIRFLLIGNGKTTQEMKQLAESLGVKNVIFYDSVFEPQALPYLQSAHVFLGFMQKTPSVDRYIPNKVFQGVALGKAVITARAPAIEEVFTENENIYLCEGANAESLKNAILKLYSDSNLLEKISNNGYALFREKFSSPVLSKELVHIFEKVIKN